MKPELERSIERWHNCKPEVIVEGSKAQVLFALQDARKDILALDQAKDQAFDHGYMTAAHEIHSWAKQWGHHDFAERVVKEINDRAARSGLPKMEPR